MNHFKPIAAFSLILFLLLGACDKEAIEENQTSSFKAAVDATYPLYAGQHEYVGDLIITIDNNNLWATFSSTGSCEFTEFALYVGELSDVPLSGGGNPKPGQFNYKNNVGDFGPISLLGLSENFVIIAHAVCGEETAWAQPVCVPSVNDYSFENVFGTPRWGWIIVPGDEDCGSEEELILTAKIQLKDTLTAGTAWGVLSTGTPSPLFSSGWCDSLSVVGIEGSNTYSIIAPQYLGSIKIADMMVENTGNELNVTFITDVPDNIIEWSYVFLGTEEALIAITNGCPDYLNFPYSNTEWSIQHSYSINLD